MGNESLMDAETKGFLRGICFTLMIGGMVYGVNYVVEALNTHG